MLNENEVMQLGDSLIQREKDVGNVDMMLKIYNMKNGIWSLDDPPKWWRDQPSSDPYDALRDATDLFAPLLPKLSIVPYGGKEKDRANADRLEQALMWHLRRSFDRRGDVQKQVIEDGFSYGREAAQLIYLPYYGDNEETMLKMFGSEKRYEMALRYGPFALVYKNARTVFPRWSDYGMSGVLSATTQTTRELIDFWGDKANNVKKKFIDNEKLKWCTTYEYCDLDQRMVWVDMHEVNTASLNPLSGEILFNEENKLPFIPWIVQDLGEPLEPLLYPIYKFDYWHSMNVMESAIISDVIAYIGAPRYVVKNGKIHIEYGDTGTIAELEGYNAEFNPLPPIGIDPGLREGAERLKERVSKSTISHNVSSGDFGASAPFSSVRELIDLASRRLNDGKRLTEKFFEEVYKQMLWWADFTGDSLVSFGERRGGEQIVVTPQKSIPADVTEDEMNNYLTFDPDMLFFEVEMTPDIEKNQVQMMNAGNLAIQLGYSRRKALELTGDTDPTATMDERKREEILDAKHQDSIQAYVEEQQFNRQMSREQRMQAAQQQMAQGQQGQQGGQGGQVSPGVEALRQMVQQQRAKGRGNEFLRGPGFDTAMGGSASDIGNRGTSSPPVQGDMNVEGGTV